jgi:hypothetical protein
MRKVNKASRILGYPLDLVVYGNEFQHLEDTVAQKIHTWNEKLGTMAGCTLLSRQFFNLNDLSFNAFLPTLCIHQQN